MRKTAVLLSVLCLIFCFAGCGEKEPAPKNTKATEKTTATTQEPTTEKVETKATEKKKSSSKSKKTAETKADSQNNIVIVLDPGHDSDNDTRNQPALGVNEQDLNLKIGLACRDRLNQYDGVTVYMTREDGSCPNAEKQYSTNGEYEDCILARTSFAEDKKADLYVSLHCNASTGEMTEGSGGAEVYVSVYPEFKEKYTPLGEIILNNISSRLNIYSRGVLTRTKPEKGTYKDGTVKDFYYLLSNNVDNGRPAIIVEHAFMDKTYDSAILKDDAKLKELGEADADGLAEFYGLKLKSY